MSKQKPAPKTVGVNDYTTGANLGYVEIAMVKWAQYLEAQQPNGIIPAGIVLRPVDRERLGIEDNQVIWFDE